MKLFVIAAVLAFSSAAAPSGHKPEAHSESEYSTTTNSIVYAPSYKNEEYADFTITSQSDRGNVVDGSRKMNYAPSEYTIRKEAEERNKVDYYGEQIAVDAGFQLKDAHLPVAPVHVYELSVAPVHEYELPVAPVTEYELPVAPALP